MAANWYMVGIAPDTMVPICVFCLFTLLVVLTRLSVPVQVID